MKTILIITGCLLASIVVFVIACAMVVSGKESRKEERNGRERDL